MLKKLLIANRGEIAIRIARTANELGIPTVAIYSKDDRTSLHVQYADEAVELPGAGVNAYLAIDSVIEAVISTGCDAIHPGYGLLSENAGLARGCTDKGLIFVGPTVDTLENFGDKISARKLARSVDIPVIEGLDGVESAREVAAFFEAQGCKPIMIKAVNGGGGRGMRVVRTEDEIESAFTRCQAEAAAAFGSAELYVERFLPSVRHIEVQIAGDGTEVIHLWERDCSIQRRNQKLLELAPAPGLNADIRNQLFDAALTIGRASKYRGLGTVEFLVELNESGEAVGFFFIETNPRIQVEHTITEEITGIDLVALQLRLAAGKTLRDMSLQQEAVPTPIGYALQARINTETLNEQGEIVPTGGTLKQFHLPGGPGIRVDTYGYAGYTTNPNFDSLLAKLIVHHRFDDLGQLFVKAERALSETRITGVETNVDFLRRLLHFPAVREWQVTVRGIEARLKDLNQHDCIAKKRYIETEATIQADKVTAKVDYPEGTLPVCSPLQSVLVALEVEAGCRVKAGEELAVVEAMKMQHVIKAPCAGEVLEIMASPGDTLAMEQALLLIREAAGTAETTVEEVAPDLDQIRPDLQSLRDRLALTLDENRLQAVQKRHARGQRMARENIADLCDENSFLEYGQLAYAAQRRRRSQEELMRESPADGIITGMGSVNGQYFGKDKSRVAVMSYDGTVMAGTQGIHGHHKTDRVLEVATELGLPLIFFTEGGGGRPGEEDFADTSATWLNIKTFHTLACQKGWGPKIAVNSGFCFAGNAVAFGSCDLKIATRNAWIGMGGPAMIEGGGLGTFGPKEIGPAPMQAKNGLIDILAEDDTQAVDYAKRLLSYFQGPLADWESGDQRLLRHAIPEDRKRVYDIRSVIKTLVDKDSFLELRPDYGLAMVTGFVRIAGQPLGLMANNPMHLGGAINAEAADKAAGFLTLCSRFKLPVLSLLDTPGFMVGPESEKEAAVRKSCALVQAGANLEVPLLAVCLRKGYGLGAQAMTGGSFAASVATVSWPTGEFGAMGLEGGVRLGYKRELEAQPDEVSRQALYDKLVNQAYEAGSALSVASLLEIDAVIDPLETRDWITRMLSH